MAKGSVGRGWNLVWRHPKILGWVFAVNLITAYLSTIEPRAVFGKVLDNSLESGRLANGFDVTAFAELISKPEIGMNALIGGSFLMAALFFFFMLFVTGGILVAYREDRRLSMGEFFEASGAYFWRMVRLVLMSIVPFGIAAAIFSFFSAISGTVGDASPNAKMGFYLTVTGCILSMVVVLLTRLWFDVAQVRAVAQDERGMFRNLMRSFTITGRALPSLFWMYLRISLFGWVTLWLGLYAWTYLSGNHVARVFVLFEIVLFAQLLTRLWQRAASVAWYGMYAEEHPAAAVDYTTAKPAELTEAPAEVQPVSGGTNPA